MAAESNRRPSRHRYETGTKVKKPVIPKHDPGPPRTTTHTLTGTTDTDPAG